MPADDRDDRGANHADHDDELLRIHDLPERVQLGMRRLVARCPHNKLVLTVYAAAGRLLAVAATDSVEWEWRRVAGRRHSAAWWLDTEWAAGAVYTLGCDRGTYRVSADLVLAATPATGTRNVGVSELAPPADVRQ